MGVLREIAVGGGVVALRFTGGNDDEALEAIDARSEEFTSRQCVIVVCECTDAEPPKIVIGTVNPDIPLGRYCVLQKKRGKERERVSLMDCRFIVMPMSEETSIHRVAEYFQSNLRKSAKN